MFYAYEVFNAMCGIPHCGYRVRMALQEELAKASGYMAWLEAIQIRNFQSSIS
jgi:hypothetical protein